MGLFTNCESKEWKPIKEHKFTRKEDGVYVISWRINDIKAREIGRIVGTDIYGILYIGRKRAGNNRIRSHLRTMLGYSKKSAAGHKFRKYFKKKGIALESLFVIFKKCRSQNKARLDEIKWLEKYCNRHAELPPLNSQLPKSK